MDTRFWQKKWKVRHWTKKTELWTSDIEPIGWHNAIYLKHDWSESSNNL